MRRHSRWADGVLHVALAAGAAVVLLPLLYAVVTSFKTDAEIVAHPTRLLPATWVLRNYTFALSTVPFGRFFMNSLVLAAASTAFVAVTSLLAGYVFAKCPFRGSTALFLLVLGTLAVPIESYLVPLYLEVKALGWLNSYAGLIWPSVISSSALFFMRQATSQVPDELLEAARIDGASEARLVFTVVLPVVAPALVAISIINWVYKWSEFIWPLIVTDSSRLYTMELGLMYFQRAYVVEYGPTMAGAILTTLPVVVVFLIFRRHIIDSIATQGLK